MTTTDHLNEPIDQTTIDPPVTETAPESASGTTPRPNFVSPIRLEANRRNALLSTGPRTEAGKQRSRLNARRHDLTGHDSVLPDADRVAIERFCKPIMAEFSPGTEYETQLARAIAESQWRLNRARSIEDNFFANEIARYPDSPIAGGHLQIADALHQARAFTRESAAFDRLTLYEQRIQRAMAKSVQLLKDAQALRLAAKAKALEETQLLCQMAAHAGQEFDVISEAKANGGFLFSLAQIGDSLERARLLESARHTPIYRPLVAKAIAKSYAGAQAA